MKSIVTVIKENKHNFNALGLNMMPACHYIWHDAFLVCDVAMYAWTIITWVTSDNEESLNVMTMRRDLKGRVCESVFNCVSMIAAHCLLQLAGVIYYRKKIVPTWNSDFRKDPLITSLPNRLVGVKRRYSSIIWYQFLIYVVLNIGM